MLWCCVNVINYCVLKGFKNVDEYFLLIGNWEKLFDDDKRLIFDDKLELCGLFLVVLVDGKKIIVVNC